MSVLKVAVITGCHRFDVIGFHDLFRGLEGVEAYIQHLGDFCASREETRRAYDVVLFYFMPREAPGEDGLPVFEGQPVTALAELGQTEQGIVVLHHALLAFPQWPLWAELVGIADRAFTYSEGEEIPVHVADGQHAITQGLADWTIHDEVYGMQDPGADAHVLLTTDHPKSMRSIAWTRQHKQSRVFCLELGHDAEAWRDEGFRTLLRRGLLWSAGRLG